jgi:hypothetical protein
MAATRFAPCNDYCRRAGPFQYMEFRRLETVRQRAWCRGSWASRSGTDTV